MTMATANDVERARREGQVLGIPLGELGWFQSLLFGVAAGMAAFFLSTFVAILSMLGYRMATGRHPDFTLTYRLAGLPVGAVVMAAALGFLGTQWARRMARKLRKR